MYIALEVLVISIVCMVCIRLAEHIVYAVLRICTEYDKYIESRVKEEEVV